MVLPRNRAICTCTKCSQSTFLDTTGQIVCGKVVSKNTRAIHRRKDNSDLGDGGNIASVASSTSTGKARASTRESAGAPSSLFAASVRHAICMLAAWLHLACGVSRTTTAIILRFLDMALNAMAQDPEMAQVGLQTGALLSTSASAPHDVRTAISSLSLEPQIIRHVSCPKCFSPYSLQGLPQTCSWKETRRSRKQCGAKLWAARATRHGPRLIPSQLYSVQSFESWLKFLLSRPGVEDLLDASYACEPGSSTLMHDIWDSPAWQSLGPFATTPGNLTFSFYIDWFNPFTNKIAGKIASCGAIIMVCLNLPYQYRHRPEYTFFAGITPPPHEPTVVTISFLLDPIVRELQELYVGKVIPTHRYPEGRLHKVAILPVIADLLAVRKALGFTSVTSRHFCSFCTLQSSNIDNLDTASWEPRIGPRVRAAAQQWRQASTQTARKALLDKNGIRWTPLHELFYRDPVQHTVLGVMHNWLEGVLQHHTRLYWGIGIPERSLHRLAQQKAGEEESAGVDSGSEMESDGGGDTDVEMLDEELADLQVDSQHFSDAPQAIQRLRTSSGVFVPGPGSDDGSEGSEYKPGFEQDIFEDSEKPAPVELFDAKTLSRIRNCIASAVIPSWIDRPPINLGEKSHGKLKADNWLTLFTIFFPLIIPEIWYGLESAPNNRLLDNFYHLVSCTHVVISHSTSSEMAKLFSDAYYEYRKSSQELFPHISSRPNHHYAMHIPDLLNFWGPLIKLSEFPYERHNGLLQNIKTNKHMWELDLTMLRQVCRRGRLHMLLQHPSHADSSELLRKALAPANSDFETSMSNSPLESRLPAAIYDAFLLFMQAKQPGYRDYRHLPHPLDSTILSPWGRPMKTVIHKTRGLSIFSSHCGNSSISFWTASGSVEYGFIHFMWSLEGIGGAVYLLVSHHGALSAQDAQYNPYSKLPELKCTLAYSHVPTLDTMDRMVVIELEKVRSQVAYYIRPPGTFGIERETIILVDLYRNQ